MSEHIVTLSPKGQITIPVSERKKFKNNKYLLKVVGNTITLKPVRIEVINDDMKDFSSLAEKSFEFWDNDEDDVYDRFYNQKK